MRGLRTTWALSVLPVIACSLDSPGFDPDLWRFAQALPLRGSKVGGWQEACAHLHFVDDREILGTPRAWTCGIQVGLPLATEEDGLISPQQAARLSSRTATRAAGPLFHSRPAWLGEDYCIELRRTMNRLFYESHKTLGARVERC